MHTPGVGHHTHATEDVVAERPVAVGVAEVSLMLRLARGGAACMYHQGALTPLHRAACFAEIDGIRISMHGRHRGLHARVEM